MILSYMYYDISWPLLFHLPSLPAVYSGMVIKGGKKYQQDLVGYGSEKTGCNSGKILALADTSNPD